MTAIGNKQVLAKNLERLMQSQGIDRNDLCRALNFKYSTVSEWLSAKKYPRIDKIELMANYFNVPKSTIIEEDVSEDLFSHFDNLSSTNLERITEIMNSLNADGQEKLIDLGDDLVQSGKYKKSDSAELEA